MNQTHEFIAIGMLFIFGLGLATFLLILTHWLGPRIKDPAKMLPYECGPEPEGTPRQQFSIQFYLVAIFFILFDIEAVFMYPWAVVFKEFLNKNLLIVVDMVIFVGILAIGFIYIWKKKALEWES